MPLTLLLTAFFIAATVATADTVGFEVRAHDLDQRWQAAEAAGVPADQLASARRELSAERDRRVGPLPYPVVSGAAISDPFRRAEATGDAAYRTALEGARRRAAAALVRLHDADGPNGWIAYEVRVTEMAVARRPADFDTLTRRWEAETAVELDARQRLAAESGGLSNGLPVDVTKAVAGLTQLSDRASQAGVETRGASDAIFRAQIYLTNRYPLLLADHQAALTALQAAAGALQHKLDLRAKADELLASLPDLLEQADQYGAGNDFDGRAAQIKANVDGARVAKDDGRLDLALADLQKLTDDLRAADGGRLPAGGLPCQKDAPDQLIVIHLATQQLVAYDKGCPFLRTPVTTGRPALPTGRGTFQIFYKAPAYHMVSPWPQGNPFYYPPTWVTDAMEFIGNGTFMHSASWQPDSTYGPGSQYGPYASHGCIHVLDGPLQQLYDWTQIGATVVVGD